MNVHGPWELLSSVQALAVCCAGLIRVRSQRHRLIVVLGYPMLTLRWKTIAPPLSFHSITIFLATLKQVYSSFRHFHRRLPSYPSVTNLRKIATFSSFSESPTFPPHQHCAVTAHGRASIPIASLSNRGPFLLPRHSPTLPAPHQAINSEPAFEPLEQSRNAECPL
jgi:hypothetical protein